MSQYKYSPKIDIVFRKLFGSEENKDLLLSLINGILDCHPRLTDLTIKNPYNLPRYLAEKTSILDVKAVDEQGTWYDIEMQIGEHGFYGKRALYYLSKMYVDQMQRSGRLRDAAKPPSAFTSSTSTISRMSAIGAGSSGKMRTPMKCSST